MASRSSGFSAVGSSLSCVRTSLKEVLLLLRPLGLVQQLRSLREQVIQSCSLRELGTSKSQARQNLVDSKDCRITGIVHDFDVVPLFSQQNQVRRVRDLYY